MSYALSAVTVTPVNPVIPSPDLETMNHQLAGAEAEREKLMKDNGRYFVELATAEASRKLSEAALAESTER